MDECCRCADRQQSTTKPAKQQHEQTEEEKPHEGRQQEACVGSRKRKRAVQQQGKRRGSDRGCCCCCWPWGSQRPTSTSKPPKVASKGKNSLKLHCFMQVPQGVGVGGGSGGRSEENFVKKY